MPSAPSMPSTVNRMVGPEGTGLLAEANLALEEQRLS
jgi:hypothetical protein